MFAPGCAAELFLRHEASNDGANPYAGVTMDVAGNLYGTTHGGGAYASGVIN
jgi:hypothetical protein